MRSKGLLFILSGPSGVGKTTLTQMVVDAFDNVKESISCTTRPKREGEARDIHYRFVSDEEFADLEGKGDFLETAIIFGHRYGTSRSLVEEFQNQGFHVVLTIDTQGAQQITKKMDAITIFVAPPSMEDLERRLQERETETPASIKDRLGWASYELEQAPLYKYQIINDDLQAAFEALAEIINKESNK